MQMRIQKVLLVSAIVLTTVVVGQTLRKQAEQQRIEAQRQEESALLCQQQRADNQQDVVVRDTTGRETAVLEGMLHKISWQEQRLVTYRLDESCEQVYTLYDLSGNEIVTFPSSEQVRSFVLNDSWILTHDSSRNRSVAYDLSGKQTIALAGKVGQVDTDSQRMTTEVVDTSYLYNLSGDKIATLSGGFPRIFEDSRQVTTYDDDSNRGYLYDWSGNEVASAKGRIIGIFEVSDGKKRLLTSAPAVSGVQSYLYDTSGSELAAFQGASPRVVEIEGNRYIKAYDRGGSAYSTLHDLSGELVTTFKGPQAAYNLVNDRIASSRDQSTEDYGFLQYDLYLQDVSGKEIGFFEGDVERYDFTADGQQLAVSYTDRRTVLYNLQAEEIATIEGTFDGFTSDGRLIISDIDSSTRLYDSIGNETAAFDGIFSTLTVQGTQMLTYDSAQDLSYLYDLSSNQQISVLEGKLSKASEDGEFAVMTTANEDMSYLYDHSGGLLSEHAGTIANFEEATRFYPPPVFSAGQYLITATSDETVYLWLL